MEWHLFALPLAPTRSGGATRNFHGYFHGYTPIRFALGYIIHMATAGAFEWPWNGMGTKPVMNSLWETPCVSC